MKQLYKSFFLITVFITIICFKALAIDDDGDPGSDVPIDGGLAVLIAAGVGYAASQLRARKQTAPSKMALTNPTKDT